MEETKRMAPHGLGFFIYINRLDDEMIDVRGGYVASVTTHIQEPSSTA